MSRKLICAIVCIICWLLVALIIALVSIGTVEPIEYGIVYNAITKTVDTDNVYPGGWYFIGPVMSFVTFPATLQNIDFTDFEGAQRKPISVKDSGGQDISLSFSLQYRLQQANVGKLYSTFQKGYENRYLSFIDQEVRNVVGKLDPTAFWTDRAGNGEKLRVAIHNKLQTVYADCVNLQIINVQLSTLREDTLINFSVQQQQKQTKLKEQKAKEIRAQIDVNNSTSQQNITQIRGKADALVEQIMAQANSLSRQWTIGNDTLAYKNLGDTCGLTPDAGLDKFIYYSNLQTADNIDVMWQTGATMFKLRTPGN